MSSPVPPATAAPPTEGSTGDQPTSSPKSGAQEVGFKYTPGPGIPDYLVGKTPAEAAALADQMYRALAAQQTPQHQTQAPGYGNPGYQPQMPQPQAPALPSNDDWLTNPQEAFQRSMAQAQQNQFTPVIEQMAQANAMTSRALAEQRFQDDFKRFGPEIHLELNRVPTQMQTFDNIKYVVDLVRGRHAHELANELAEQKLQERMAAGTLRPSTTNGDVAPSDPTGVDFSQLPEGYQAVLQRAGVKEVRDLDRFLLKYYGSDVNLQEARKNWFDLASKGNVVVESIKGAGYRRES
jgi:hypothetical protein